MITCKHCNVSKTEENFYFRKTGGIAYYKCKECIFLYQRQTRTSPEGRVKRQKYLTEWRQRSLRQKIVGKNHTTQWKALYPEKRKAHTAVLLALQSGRLVRPLTCEVCGKQPEPCIDGRSRIQAHHHDYSKPLEVHWLCSICHAAEHTRPDVIAARKGSGADQEITNV